MPSLKLPKLIRRDAARPTLKQRMAGLKASAGRVMRRPRVEAPMHAAVSDDSALLAVEAEFSRARHASTEASDAYNAIYDGYEEPAMPKALRFQGMDSFYPEFPRPRMVPLEEGRLMACPYGRVEVERLRGHHHQARGINGFRELQADKQAQARADAVVAAWDAWQAEIKAAQEAIGLPAAETAADVALTRCDEIFSRIETAPAGSLVGLGIKARIASALLGGADLTAQNIEEDGDTRASDLALSIARDVLALTAAGPAAQPDADLIALGLELKALQARIDQADAVCAACCDAANAALPARPASSDLSQVRPSVLPP